MLRRASDCMADSHFRIFRLMLAGNLFAVMMDMPPLGAASGWTATPFIFTLLALGNVFEQPLRVVHVKRVLHVRLQLVLNSRRVYTQASSEDLESYTPEYILSLETGEMTQKLLIRS